MLKTRKSVSISGGVVKSLGPFFKKSLFYLLLRKFVDTSNWQVTTVRRNLGTQGLEVDNDMVRETWYPVFRRNFLRQALGKCYDCRKGFWMYQQVSRKLYVVGRMHH